MAPSKLQTLKKAWEDKTLAPQVKRFAERRPQFTTSSDTLAVKALYAPDDVQGDTLADIEATGSITGAESYLANLGFPGEYPFTRGVQANMYRGRFWTMRQYAGFGTAAESNQRYRYLLAQGQTGLSVAFDLPTQIGYDADHAFAEGEVIPVLFFSVMFGFALLTIGAKGTPIVDGVRLTISHYFPLAGIPLSPPRRPAW